MGREGDVRGGMRVRAGGVCGEKSEGRGSSEEKREVGAVRGRVGAGRQ